MFKWFKYKIIGVLCILYSMSFLAFDLYFCLVNNLKDNHVIQNSDKELIAFVIASSMAALSALICVVLFVIFIKDIAVGVKRYFCGK